MSLQRALSGLLAPPMLSSLGRQVKTATCLSSRRQLSTTRSVQGLGAAATSASRDAASSPSSPSVSTFTPSASSPAAATNLSYLSSLLDSRQPGWSLQRDFYTDPLVFAYELKWLWSRAWLFAGYSFQLPRCGDYFTYEVGDDSLIVIRAEEAREGDPSAGVRAFHNSCRHRGSRIVDASGDTRHTRRLVCPYHQWSSARDGSLVHARDMSDDSESGGGGGAPFDKGAHGLHEVHVQEVEGLLFLSLTPKHHTPLFDFAPARALLAPQLAPHGLRRAKLAYTAHYRINANWKLVYENNRECYHCAVSHPEYIQSNYDLHLTYRRNDATGQMQRDLDPTYPGRERIVEWMRRKSDEWAAMGLECSPDSSFPGEGWYRASRMPLRQGWVSESLDGQPVSTLMGSLAQRDMGSFRIHTLPNFWLHLSSDHGVSSRLTPAGNGATLARVDWIVDERAEEGRDYTLERLLPLWSKTSDQDWALCERNQQGVLSSAYRSGKLSQRKEAGLDRFLQWYIECMKKGVAREQQEREGVK